MQRSLPAPSPPDPKGFGGLSHVRPPRAYPGIPVTATWGRGYLAIPTPCYVGTPVSLGRLISRWGRLLSMCGRFSPCGEYVGLLPTIGMPIDIVIYIR